MRLACHANYVHSHCSTHMPLTLNHPCHFDPLQVISILSKSFRSSPSHFDPLQVISILSRSFRLPHCHFDRREKSVVRQRATLTLRIIMWGVASTRRGLFVSAKVPRRAGTKARYKKLLLHPRHRIPNQNLPIIQDLTKRATGPRFRHGLLQARQGLLHPFTGFRLA